MSLNLTLVDDAWNIFKNKFLEAERATVPMRTRRPNNGINSPWITIQVRRLINLEKRNYNAMKENNTAEAREQYHSSLRVCRTLIRQCNRDQERQIAREAETNPKKFFIYIRTKKKSKRNIGPLKDESGALAQDNGHMVEILNKNFASVFTVENTESVPKSPVAPRGQTPLEIGSMDKRDVRKYLDRLKTDKSTGPDDLLPRLLKELPLTAIYNQSLHQKQVPEDWKQSNVTPIYKKGHKCEALNYRPITLTSVARKIMEKIIRDKLVKFLDDNNIISDVQHGFRNKRSCLTNLHIGFFCEYLRKLG